MSWWRNAVVYAVDVRVFGDGDATGNLDGAVQVEAGEELGLTDPAPVPGAVRAPMPWDLASAHLDDPGSTLSLYRRALELRRGHAGFTAFADEDELEWFGAPPGRLAFRRPGSCAR